jgi:AraC-like DNA-binding protein
MDQHNAPGVTARDVAEAHRMDILIQDEHDCKCMTYWIDEKRGTVFCLIEAPDKQSVVEMHSKSHGLIPHRIIEVSDGLVESFLGRISDPEEAEISGGLKVFSDSSYRILLFVKTDDPVLLGHKLGMEKANEILRYHTGIIRKEVTSHGGSEVEHERPVFIASFTSAGKAVSCALAVRQILQNDSRVCTRIAISAGDPVSGSDKLFGDTIQSAECLCSVAKDGQIAITSAVKDLVAKDHLHAHEENILALSPQEETLLQSLFEKLEKNWQDPAFNVTDYCLTMTMSKSQLYRKAIALSGLPPHTLLKDFRLEKARELMRAQRYSISQVTFDSGFTSPSYFTKCFKKKYGLLPMNYLDLLHQA